MSAQALAGENTSAIHLTDAKVGLILGGDAEMSNGKDWKLFSEDNARKLSKEIAAFIKKTGYKILITNGPRTGRSTTAHKTEELDVISAAFLQELEREGLVNGTDFEFFNFQFGKLSALKAVMKIVLNNKGFMIVPGESTSSISEILAVIPASIYAHDAMNEQHRAFVEKLTQSHHAALWPRVPDPALMDAYVPLPSQAVNVVADFLK
jgi:mitochondrial fission protein ELM1